MYAVHVGAVLARDKGATDIRLIASSLIAGKHRSHRESIVIREAGAQTITLNRAISRRGGAPNSRLYSRLN